MEWKTVTRDEFLKFLENYPNELVADVTGICEPPLESYNDFSKGDWPDSMVAKVIRDWMGPNGETATDKRFYEYKILTSKGV